MASAELRELIERLLRVVSDKRLDDATFRRRVKRLASPFRHYLDRSATRKSTGRYVYIAVPGGLGKTTSISMTADEFARFTEQLGGRSQTAALARKVAVGFKAESGLTRSTYVRRRLQQHIEKRLAAAQDATATPQPPRTRLSLRD